MDLLDIDLLSPFKDFFKWVGTNIASISQDIAGAIVGAFTWVGEEIGEGIATFTKGILNIDKRMADKIAQDDLEGAIKLYTPILAGGLATDILISLLQTKIVGSGLDLMALNNRLNRLLPLETPYSVILNSYLNASVGIQSKYMAQKKLRPLIPSVSDAWSMYVRGEISEKELEEIWAMHGFDDKWIAKLKTVMWAIPSSKDLFIMWRKGIISEGVYKSLMSYLGYPSMIIDALTQHYYYDVSPFDLARISTNVEVPETWLKQKLRNLGFNETDISIYSQALLRMPARSFINSVVYDIKDSYKNGFLTDSELKEYLSKLGLGSYEKSYIDTGCKLELDTYLTRLKQTMYVYQYRNDVFGTIEPSASQTLYTKLRSIGVRDVIANVIVNTERARKGLPDIEFSD